MYIVHRREIGENPYLAMQSMLSFMDIKIGIDELRQLLESTKLSFNVQNYIKVLNRPPRSLWNITSSTIKNELEISDGLKKWPCRSFKELTKELNSFKYWQFAANCSAPHVICSVRFDMAEQIS